MTKQKQILERLRRNRYKRDEFLVLLSKRLEMFTILGKREEIKRGIKYLRKTIIKEISNSGDRNKIRQQIKLSGEQK